MIAGSNSVFGKIVGSGWKNTVVPVPRAGPSFTMFPWAWPFRNSICHSAPPRFTFATSFVESAFTTEAPTPWRPPDVL